MKKPCNRHSGINAKELHECSYSIGVKLYFRLSNKLRSGNM